MAVIQQGWNQQTPAIRSIISGSGATRSASGARRKRRSKRKASTRRRATSKTRSTASASGKRGRLKKGSPAAKARMAKLRAMQKKR